MQNPIEIQKCYRPTDKHGKVSIRGSTTKKRLSRVEIVAKALDGQRYPFSPWECECMMIIVAKALDGQRYPLPTAQFVAFFRVSGAAAPEGQMTYDTTR